MATKVLWFSRHKMSQDQLEALRAALGEVEVTQVNGTAPNVHVPFEASTPEAGAGVDADVVVTGAVKPLKELCQEFDEVAAVLPIGMVQQILPFCKAGRMLQTLNKRVIDDTGKANFVFDGWKAVKEVKIVMEDL